MLILKEKKAFLRKKVLQKRSDLIRSELEKLNHSIFDHTLKSELVKNANTVHCYISMNNRNEVDTKSIIKVLLDVGKAIIVPIIDSNQQLIHSRLASLEHVKTNTWGVSEPIKIHEVDLSTIDLVLVPLLAVDKAGNRLGYGKGFYDRFLENISVLKLGLVFEQFVFEKLPSEKHDVKLDGIITENGVRLL